jgi:PucR C-terminal helix-turn-helix domain/GGDEF-like domain
MNHPLRSRVALSRILSVLGPSLLTARWTPTDGIEDVMDIVIWDVVDEPAVSSGDLVLGVGVRERETQVALARRLGGTRCAGIVLKNGGEPHDPLPAEVVEAAAAGGVPLVQLTNGASWEQIVVLIRSLIVSGTPGADSPPASTVTDLFTLAEVVSAVLGAPVTIEDRSSRVLAFSEDQSGVDEARAETILGRQVPDRYVQQLSDRGVFRRLLQDPQPVYVDGLYDGMKPRTAVGVRAGQEVLGSIWAATDGRLSAEREQWLIDAARLVALHLLRLRSETDVRQRMWADHLATLLQGGQPSLEMAARLGLAPGPACVVAATTGHAEGAAAEADLQRLETSLMVHLKAVRPRAAVARVNDVVYAVLSPVDAADDDGRGPAALMQDFIDYADPSRTYLVGVGRPTRSFADIARSRSDADKTLRALRHDTRGRKVARFVDVQVDSLLLRLVDLVVEDEDMALGPLAALVAYDDRHHGNLLETLVAFLDAFGDVSLAAKSVHVHANTFRYRLRRLSAISGIDLENPDTRFGVMLRLRLWELGRRGDARFAFSP